MSTTVRFTFTEEEIRLLNIYLGETKNETLENIYKAMPHIDDYDMRLIAENVIAKITDMSDDELLQYSFGNEQEV